MADPLTAITATTIATLDLMKLNILLEQHSGKTIASVL
jgi:hypothetical protein